MDEEIGIRPKNIFCDLGDEEDIAWNIRWAKKQESALKPFPLTIELKKPQPGVSDGRRKSHFL